MKLVKQDIPFTMVANDVLKDKSLSLKAKGLYSYLFSKPDEWDFSGHRMIMETKDGKKAIFSALKELEDNGYLSRERLTTGRMQYTLKHSLKSLVPILDTGVEKPDTLLGYETKRLQDKRGTVSNKEGISNKDEESKTYSETGVSQDIVKIIDSFIVTNSAYRKWYGNTTQRGACERLLKSFPIEQILKVTAILPKTNKIPYMPSINTPLQLEDKWSQLEAQLTKKKLEINSKKPQVIL